MKNLVTQPLEFLTADFFGWIVDQLTVLAVALDVQLTPQRMQIYAEDLAELSLDELQMAFVRARREWSRTGVFPTLSELRDLAGAGAKDRRLVEAQLAWDRVQSFLVEWGVNPLPLWSQGKVINPPRLDERTDYALRRVGGLWAVNAVQVGESADPRALSFIRKEFV